MQERIEVDKRQTLRRVHICIAAFALLWAYVVAITGGFVIRRARCDSRLAVHATRCCS